MFDFGLDWFPFGFGLVCSIDIFCCTGADLLISVIGRVVRRSTAVWSQKCLVACMYTVNTDHTCCYTG